MGRKIYITILLIFLATLSAFLLEQTRSSKSNTFNPNILGEKDAYAIAETDKVNKYSIQYFRERSYTPSEITILETLESPTEFNSYTFSYYVEGLKQYGLLNIPNDIPSSEGFPVVVIAHGHVDPAYYSTEKDYRAIADIYAENGFIVLKPDYRGHGKSEGVADDPLARFNYTVDVLTLLYSLENVKGADTDNVFIYSHSMGGDITLRILETTDMVKGASLWAPVTAPFPDGLTYYLLKNYNLRVYEKAKNYLDNKFTREDYISMSPTKNLKYINAPIIIHHGSDDDQVPLPWTEGLEDEMKKLNKEINVYVYNGDDHSFTRGYWNTAAERDVFFFKSLIK